MNKAIVTGTTSGIGLEIAKGLLERGWFVYGIGRDFKNAPENDNFCRVPLDLTDREALTGKITEIRKGVTLLINNAGVGYFGLHEELSPRKIHEITAVNLEAPMIITGLMLRELKKTGGRIINISSHAAKHSSPHGAAYAAAKAGLTHFSESIFDEARKYGVFVSAIHPDITATAFYDSASFTYEEGEDFSLSPKDVAEAVFTILSADYPIKDITLTPKKHRIRYKNKVN
ncbi:MAG: SDR family oxidoreductase [Clostridiales bacterium]|nr:SDR family oxidoreductase [Clostridiales bacterium]